MLIKAQAFFTGAILEANKEDREQEKPKASKIKSNEQAKITHYEKNIIDQRSF